MKLNKPRKIILSAYAALTILTCFLAVPVQYYMGDQPQYSGFSPLWKTKKSGTFKTEAGMYSGYTYTVRIDTERAVLQFAGLTALAVTAFVLAGSTPTRVRKD